MTGPVPSLAAMVHRTGIIAVALGVSLLLAACSSGPTGPLPDPPADVTTAEVEALIAEGAPSVVNVWASWCIPCRSEAPVVSSATTAYPDVTFIGLNVRDAPGGAQEFIAEFLADADMVHVADRSGSIPVDLGGTNGVPLTYFYDANGTLAHLHFGVIDEPTMARYLDEIDR